MEWISLIQTLGGIAGGLGLGMFTKSGRRKDKAEADAKVQEAQRLMIDNYEERIKDLHENKKRLNEEADHYIARISQQNHALDSKTEQIRNLTQKLWEAEQETNNVNAKLDNANKRITQLTAERDNYNMWQCRSRICEKGNPDPEGRQPPNPKLKGMEFHIPSDN